MRRRGFTLFELMVALALGAIVLAVLANAVVPLTRQILTGFQEMELAREAQAVSVNWERDLGLTPFEGRDLLGSSRWVMRPLQDQPVSNDRAYAPELVAYELEDGTLSRRQVATSALPATEAGRAQWGPLLAGPGVSRRLALGVASFRVETEGSTVLVDAELVRTVANRRLSYRLHRVYGSRNP